MVSLQLSSHSISEGEPLTLRVGEHPALASASALGIDLHGVEEAETAFRLSTTLSAAVVDGKLEATLEGNIASRTLNADRLFEIVALQIVDAEGSIAARITGGTDFPRVFFRVKETPEEPSLTPEQAAENAREVELRREELYAEPHGDPRVPGSNEFRIIMFIERLLLTHPLRVPGLQMTLLIESWQPVQKSFGFGASDELEVINMVLRDWNWTSPQQTVEPSSWRESNSRNRPVVLMHIPRIFATSPNHALWLAHNKRDRLLELLAFRRNALGVPFATAIQQLDSTTRQYTDLRVYPEVEQYRGNLMGGFLSGEDQSGLMADYKIMQSEPFLSFVLYLHAEAQAEKDLDFAYFRYWNLLETVASEHIEPGTPVTNFDGKQILKGDGKPFDTGGARGRVYELVKRGMQEHGQSEETHQEAHDLSLSLWNAVHVWYGFRNATAHHGGFNPDDPNQQRQPWYKVAVDAQGRGAQPKGYRNDPYFGYLKAVTTEVVRWLLESNRGTNRTSTWVLEGGENPTTSRE